MLKILALSFLAVILFACNTSSDKDFTIDDFYANNNNLILDKEHKYQDIEFKLPESFTDYYSNSITIGNNSRTFNQYKLGLIFTVEKFTENDVYRPFVRYEPTTSNLTDLFHSGYVNTRARSIDESEVSIKKSIKTSKKLKGIIQYVSDKDYYKKDVKKIYATATFQIKKDYYVFQWIVDNEMMSYTMDDFMQILNSVKPRK
jgi:hypothetical protein